MMEHIMDKTLADVQHWATERLRSGAEPPWTYYRLMQLLDAIDGLRDPDLDITKGHSLQSEPHSGSDPRPEAAIYSLDELRHRRECSPEPQPT